MALARRARLVAPALPVLLASAQASAQAPADTPAPTVVWGATQLVPSPTLGWDGHAPAFGLRWQITPVLWSFGIHRAAPTRFRSFVVEPTYRYSGSVELHVTPEWLDREGRDEVLARTGLRVYVPVSERGERLAVSIGSGAWIDGSRLGAEVEVGAYVLAGLLGVQVGWAPGLAGARLSTTLRVRVL